MSLPRRFACVILASALAVAALPDAARPQAPKAFEPQVGQDGKDVIWVPTPQELVDRMLELARVTSKDVVIDLGSGDGRTVITAAKLGTKAHGIEYNPNMVELSKRNAEREKVSDRATFAKADIFDSDFSQATVITMFLLSELNLRLRPKLLGLKPGTRLVSNTFDMGDWKHDAAVEVGYGCSSYCKAYLWIVPAKVAGNWQLVQDADKEAKRTINLVLKQKYQELSGTATEDTPAGATKQEASAGAKQAKAAKQAKQAKTAASSLSAGRVRAEEITFTIANTRYSGVLKGETISGTYQAGSATGAWSATRSK